MTIRERCEMFEKQYLSKQAALSSQSRGRERPEQCCAYRTAFQRDRDRILHSKAFRRLMHKTQVFLSPEGDHYRTRLTHTAEVSQIARTIARALLLNEDLTEAISLGHDLGHTPFGHAGERALNDVMEGGFRHYEQSVRTVEALEKDGEGLNLTWEVRDGILHHTCGDQAATLEGHIVRISDRVAYLNHDIDDAVRAGLLKEEMIPAEILEVLGKGRTKRIDTLVVSIIGAFTEWLSLPLGEYDIANLAYSIEREDLKLEGGKQDQYAATFGGFNFMEFYSDNKVIVNPLRVKSRTLNELSRNIVLYYTETSRQSSDIIKMQQENVKNKNSF